ncbi:hypothetical protein R1flu_025269 [Riccia fluitans]|uniref:CCHC-type domain-containing protein n=1 Tax=Riccia fluitans TaxID=41844 RepID=A0ABD1XXB1_9MARC
MADSQDDDRDEEWFKEVYGREYTGPPRPPRDNPRDESKSKKRPGANATVAHAGDDGSDEEDEPRDPNAVPTDFTSREAKVWEAKAKAVERNWKRRKEEELTCRICGEVGHFAQGCPTTLGGNRKPGEVVERISLRDKRLKPRIIGTGGAVIQGIEKDTGCRLKLEDNLAAGNGAFFVRISGPDRLTVIKAVDVVTKLVEQVEDEWKQPQQMRRPHGVGGGGGAGGGSYRGSNVNPLIAAQMQHIAVQRLQHSAPNLGPLGRADGPPPPLDEDKRTIEHIASQLEARRQWEAVSGSNQNLNGSGASPPFSYKDGRGASGGSVSSYSGKAPSDVGYYHSKNLDGPYQSHSGGAELDQDLDGVFEEKGFHAQTLEELEQRFLQETIELTKDQNMEEDKEKAKHRERMNEIHEQYQQKMSILRSKHTKQREEFLRHEAQMRHQQYQQQTGYGMYPYGGGGGGIPHSRGGPYNGNGYDRGANSASPENVQGHMGMYDSYKDGGMPYSNSVSHSYSRKQQGYESSKNYGNQGYDSGGYGFGNSQGHPAYG